MKTPLIIFLLCTLHQLKFSSANSRIIGGQIAYAGEFPYAAAIWKTTADGSYFCTGSILTNQWILTAGQCVDGATLFTILIGAHKLDGDTSSSVKLATEEYVLHPDYVPQTLIHDIGLIKFREPVTFTTYIKQLYLPHTDVPVNSAVGVAYGWGQTSDDDSQLSNNLNYVTLFGVSDAECRVTYGDQLMENMVCFEGNYNEGACFGDSGSPIIQHVNRGYTVVIAISTFFSGNGCESTDPSGYTKVYPYNEWISNYTGSIPQF